MFSSNDNSRQIKHSKKIVSLFYGKDSPMEEIQFEVQGSASEPYLVRFVKRSGTNLSAYCTCPAGQQSQYCKHRFSILDGISKGIISNNVNDVKTVQSWLPGTDVDDALKQVRLLESEQQKLKTKLSAAKKQVAKAMRD